MHKWVNSLSSDPASINLLVNNGQHRVQHKYHYIFKLAYETPGHFFFVVAWPLAQELTLKTFPDPKVL